MCCVERYDLGQLDRSPPRGLTLSQGPKVSGSRLINGEAARSYINRIFLFVMSSRDQLFFSLDFLERKFTICISLRYISNEWKRIQCREHWKDIVVVSSVDELQSSRLTETHIPHWPVYTLELPSNRDSHTSLTCLHSFSPV